ncbi:hypothetical protein [Streptomyces sp. NPDC001315]|uniref:hypothetical protein n=1 Tax=Streptomyces sp. NPDC001315 TaxID=3364562 RepID=UPI00369C6C9D
MSGGAGPAPRAPRIHLDLVQATNRTGHWPAALANSFGFGGHTVSLVLTTTS